ncbi:MAG TPA: DUF488 domain-containing protein [Sphingomonas sp.]|nr:DUF488 domain-containing protein [Sphingomonas sp.]
MKLYTIGFTQTKAQNFFDRLEKAGVKSVLDTRLNRVSQLAGFAKQADLSFFLERLSGIHYSVEQSLAPTADMLDAYRKKEIGWSEYERRYLELLNARKVENSIDMTKLDYCCLLCSEAKPDHCHRRLAANYLAEARDNITIIHL